MCHIYPTNMFVLWQPEKFPYNWLNSFLQIYFTACIFDASCR